MTKRFGLGAIVVCVLFGSFSAAQEKPKTWTGWITDEHCPPKGAKMEHKSCATKCLNEEAGKPVLHDRSKSRHSSLLMDDPRVVVPHIGHEVRVTGTGSDRAIKVELIERIR